MGPAKDVTMRNWHFTIHCPYWVMLSCLSEMQPLVKISRLPQSDTATGVSKFSSLGPMKCCCTPMLPLHGFSKGCYNVQRLAIHGPSWAMLYHSWLDWTTSLNCLIHIAKYSFFFIAATLRFLYPWYRFLCIQYRYVCASFRYHCIFNTVTYVLITYPNKYLLQSGVYLIHSHMYMLLFINVYNKKANCSDQNQVCICH